MQQYLVGPADDLAEGGRKVVRCGEREVGVFRVNGELRAWLNACPHRQGPICQGHLYPRVVEPVDDRGEVRLLDYDRDQMQVVCPWHGYEFDLDTGRCNGHPALALRSVQLTVVAGDIYVHA